MPAYLDGRDLLFYPVPGAPAAQIRLPKQARAVGTGHGASVLLDSGVVLVFSPNGRLTRRRVPAPGADDLVAVSADGRLVVTASGDAIEARCDNEVLDVPTPEWLCDITGVRCAADGESFGYTYLTSQPWSDFGSYGDRMYGAVVVSTKTGARLESWDTRRHDEEPDILLAWGGDNLVTAMGGEVVWETCAPPERAWDQGPAGGNSPREDFTILLHADVAHILVPPEGGRATLTGIDGQVWVSRAGEGAGLLPDVVGATDPGGEESFGLILADRTWAQRDSV